MFVPLSSESNFNTILVQLKRDAGLATPAWVDTFQYHTGTIKTPRW